MRLLVCVCVCVVHDCARVWLSWGDGVAIAVTASSSTSVEVSLSPPTATAFNVSVAVVLWTNDLTVTASSVRKQPFTSVTDVLALTRAEGVALATTTAPGAQVWTVLLNGTSSSTNATDGNVNTTTNGAVVVLASQSVPSLTVVLPGLVTDVPYAFFAACNNVGDDIGPFTLSSPGHVTLTAPSIDAVSLTSRTDVAMSTQGGTRLTIVGSQLGTAAYVPPPAS